MVFSGKATGLPRISSFDATQSMQGGLPIHRRSITNDSANQIYEMQDPRYQDGSLIEEEMTFEELSSKLGGLHQTHALSDEQQTIERRTFQVTNNPFQDLNSSVHISMRSLPNSGHS